VELDERPEVMQHLTALTHMRTVPQVFIQEAMSADGFVSPEDRLDTFLSSPHTRLVGDNEAFQKNQALREPSKTKHAFVEKNKLVAGDTEAKEDSGARDRAKDEAEETLDFYQSRLKQLTRQGLPVTGHGRLRAIILQMRRDYQRWKDTGDHAALLRNMAKSRQDFNTAERNIWTAEQHLRREEERRKRGGSIIHSTST
jgi:Flp pilus assembly protein CpaB